MLILLLTSCFNNKNTVNINIASNVNKLDSQTTMDSSENFLLQHIFEGLTTEDEKGKTVPAVAESWKAEGTTWTFIINPDAKWANGKQVKAEDFVTAWERVISSINNNENAYKMFMIKNAMEYNQNKVSFDYVGIKAVDDKTLVVELKEENPYFDTIVAQILFYPVNKKFYESHKEKYGVGKKNILGNGAYKINSWKDSKNIELTKSKKYKNKDKIKIGKINFLINGDVEVLKKLYENNKVQVLNLAQNEGLNHKDSKKFHTGNISFIQFNVNENLFSNKKIRKAISMSIDRNEFNNQFFYGKDDIAESFIPQNISGKEKSFREEYNQKDYEISYEPTKAKLLFQEGLKELGMNSNDVKNISLLVRSTESEVAMGNFIKNKLRENLNLNINIKTETSQMREQIINSRDFSFTIDYFSSDIMEGAEYLSSWTSKNYRNFTNWQKEEYDNLIETTTKEKEFSKRIEILHEAEKLLMDELPIIPLTFSEKSYIIKNNIVGSRLSNVSGELDFRYAYIEKENK